MKKLLTPLELKIMNILWDIKNGVVHDILERWNEEPKPKYQTVSTIIRLLEKPEKGEFIGHKAYGRTHVYFPKISKIAYQKTFLTSAVKNVFSGSMATLVSALVDQDKISKTELEELKGLIDDIKD